MTKSIFRYLFALLTLSCVLVACSDDDDDETPAFLKSTVFTDVKGLTLDYSDEPLLGKQVEFTPNGTKATLVLSGENTNEIFMNNGVVPGEATTTLNVDLKVLNERATFEGEDNQNGRLIKYKGEVSENALKLDLEVTMPQHMLTGRKFNLAETKTEWDDDLFDYVQVQSPILFKWDSEKKVIINGQPNEPFNAIMLILGFMPIEGADNAIDALEKSLKSVEFRADGNIRAEYNDSLHLEDNWQMSPLNVATYAVEDEHTLRLFINPAQIVAVTNKLGRSGIDTVLPTLVEQLTDLLVNGIVLHFKEATTDGMATVYLNEEVLLPILKTIKPLLEDKDLQAALKDEAFQMMPGMEFMIEPILDGMFASFPGVIETTKSMEVGLNFIEMK